MRGRAARARGGLPSERRPMPTQPTASVDMAALHRYATSNSMAVDLREPAPIRAAQNPSSGHADRSLPEPVEDVRELDVVVLGLVVETLVGTAPGFWILLSILIVLVLVI